MQTQVWRLVSVLVEIAVPHLAAGVTEVGIGQLNFQNAAFAAQISRLGEDGSTVRPRADFFFGASGSVLAKTWRGKTKYGQKSGKQPRLNAKSIL